MNGSRSRCSTTSAACRHASLQPSRFHRAPPSFSSILLHPPYTSAPHTFSPFNHLRPRSSTPPSSFQNVQRERVIPPHKRVLLGQVSLNPPGPAMPAENPSLQKRARTSVQSSESDGSSQKPPPHKRALLESVHVPKPSRSDQKLSPHKRAILESVHISEPDSSDEKLPPHKRAFLKSTDTSEPENSWKIPPHKRTFLMPVSISKPSNPQSSSSYRIVFRLISSTWTSPR